jgi:predicted transcriptional regulator of viral defense system
MLNDTKLGGGIRPVSDVLNNYMQSPHKNLNALFEYALRIKNKTVFKRLGYLMEKFHAEEREIIQQCHARISSGYSKLDPDLDADKLITRWKLWIPESWAGKG